MAEYVRPKKHLGQHFLTDKSIAKDIVNAIHPSTENLLEIGAGTGVLTQYILEKKIPNFKIIEIDSESVNYLLSHFADIENLVIEADFLHFKIQELFPAKFSLIGNFPYNISNQILFKVYEYRDQVEEVVGMFQKEVAERIAAKPGSKTYGILSALLQAYYDVEYLFTVNEDVFNPPPKVKSGVLRLRRKEDFSLPCGEKLFFTVVKTAFQQRRKTLRNSLKTLNLSDNLREDSVFDLRPEQLSVEQFIELTQKIEADGV